MYNRLADTLTVKVPEALTDMGISADMRTVHQRGSYVVIQCKIVRVDKLKLLSGSKGSLPCPVC